MAANPLATAYVAVRPDFTGFDAAVAAQAATALRSIQVLPGQLNLFPGGPGPVKAVGDAAEKTGQQVRRAAGETGNLGNQFLKTKQSALNLQAGLIGAGQGAVSSRLAFFGLQGVVASFGAAAAFSAIRAADDLQISLNTLAVVAGASRAELEQISEVAKQLGADVRLPAVSAADAGNAMTNLARAGLSVRDAMDGARGVLQLAAAAQTDNATAAVVAARALNAFNLAGAEATRVADLLTGASIAGGASIEEIAVALQQSAAAAAQINVTLNETTNALALLARNGLAGSDAGTSLRTALLRLNPQTREAKELVEALGIEVFNSRGQFIGLPAAIEQYRSALSGLTDEQRQAALSTIFGQDAFRAISILTREGARGFSDIAQQAERHGIAAELAAARTSGLRGQLLALQSNAETLGIELGELATGPLASLVGGMNDIVGAAQVAARGLRGLINEVGALADTDIPFTDTSFGDAIKGAIGDFTPSDILIPVRVFGAFRDGAEEAADGINTLAQAGTAAVTPLRILRDELQRRLVDATTLIDPSEVTNALRRLEDILTEGGVAVGDDFVENLQRSLAGLDPRQALDAVRGLIVQATTAGREVGDALGLGMADGVRAAQVEAVRAAQETLNEVVREGQEAVVASVQQAKQNLFTIANEISSQFQQIVDASPLGRQIERLQAQLDSSNTEGERRRLISARDEAVADLREAERSISRLGDVSPEGEQRITEFLRPFRDGVSEAKTALEDFNTKGVIDKLETVRDKQVETVEQGLRDLVAKFNTGQLSVTQVNNRLAALLGGSVAKGRFGKSGSDLGIAFTAGFQEHLASLRAQVTELLTFAGGGTGQAPDVVKPGETAAQARARAERARNDLLTAQAELKKSVKVASDNEVAVLKQIRDRLPKPDAQKPGGGRPAGSNPDRPGDRGGAVSAAVGPD